ncbi:hypothetical protein HOP50_03g20140 [Chloropicon primus]|uniref:Uncharacterized protein n=1 Tax=Chloropicon primus TaxID=1764295 RepID=A0A5B8MGH7_9CHLO|nr:hypothetical protein A3770_03p20150 [Chloropicon primus]UPQ98708.1 hypothetical protein HOP50_03g20140 [Chloropicon primus]|mmetsp:Transcript_10724/g.30205  ORF Transcript_10724/g.30205 Transcript_10724/m.30205 type:complete len:277 (+) Transcript_10724:359-1189(+)|eukprot:QDZ19497.1 hypothetical protein A3770_03p20150 [Chloropicon primus]
MASLLGGSLLQAREGAHFKAEAEGDLHQYLLRRTKEGAINLSEEELRGIREGRRRGGGGGSARRGGAPQAVFEVGMEILQQESRYETMDSQARKRMLTRVKAAMPDASPEDLRRISTNMAMYGAAGALYGAQRGQRIHLGGGRRALAELSRESAKYANQEHIKELSPEAKEAMRRQFFAGLRALTYGSLVGLVGVAGAVTLAANALDIEDAPSLRASIKATLEPLRTTFEGVLRGFVSVPRGSPGAAANASGSGGGMKDSQFAKKLKERFENFKVT